MGDASRRAHPSHEQKDTDVTTRRDESGSALVIVLLLVFIAAVVAATAFAFSETSVRAANQSYAPARKHDVDANSAIQAAIQYVRNDPAAGQDPNGNPTCLQSPDPQHSFTYTSNVIVNICPRQGSFVL